MLARHRQTSFERPIPPYGRQAFAEIAAFLGPRVGDAIFDWGCGNGDSSILLARRFPDQLVIGIDKSPARLSRKAMADLPENLRLVRADAGDVVRLSAEAGWRIAQQAFYFPNPWPKAAHLGRRWHGAPYFKAFIELGGAWELRTNWGVYAEEFCIALTHFGREARLMEYCPTAPFTTLFERKYALDGQELFKVTTTDG